MISPDSSRISSGKIPVVSKGYKSIFLNNLFPRITSMFRNDPLSFGPPLTYKALRVVDKEEML